MDFATIAERMEHPEGQLIPTHIWNSYFINELPDNLIPLMQANEEKQLLTQIEKILPQLTYSRDKSRVWLAILLSHPDFSFEQFDRLGSLLSMSPQLIFQTAAALGNEAYFSYLITRHEDQGSLQEMITSDDFFAFQCASATGQISILHQLLNKAGNKASKMVAAEDYKSFVWAAGGGHLETMIFLVQQAPKCMEDIISSYDYGAFIAAAENGHLQILNYLISKAPNEVQSMIFAGDFASFRRAVWRNHKDVALFLLNYPLVFAYVEEHDVGKKYYLNFVEATLKELNTQKKTWILENPDVFFDVKDQEKAKLLFYMLRHLIRLNDPSAQENILVLLDIPSVKLLITTMATPKQSNELVRLAKKIGNIEAAHALLQIPEVFELARLNHFYPKDEGLDLSTLVDMHKSQEKGTSQDEVPFVHFIWIGSMIPEKSDIGPKALAAAHNSDGKKYPIIYWVDDENLESATDLFEGFFNIEVRSINELIEQFSQGSVHQKERIISLIKKCKEENLPTVVKELLSPILMAINSGYFLDTSIRIVDDCVNLPILNLPAIPRNFLNCGNGTCETAPLMARSDLYAYYSPPNPFDYKKSGDRSKIFFNQFALETLKVWHDFFIQPLAIKGSLDQLFEDMVLKVLIKPVANSYQINKELNDDLGLFSLVNDEIVYDRLITRIPQINTIDNIPLKPSRGRLYINGLFTHVEKLFSGKWKENFLQYLIKRVDTRNQELFLLIDDIQKIINSYRSSNVKLDKLLRQLKLILLNQSNSPAEIISEVKEILEKKREHYDPSFFEDPRADFCDQVLKLIDEHASSSEKKLER